MQGTLADADHFHVMGSSLSSPEFVALNVDTALAVKNRGGTIFFDPNLRKEILDAPGMRVAMMQILAVTDLFLPSDEELTLLTVNRLRAGTPYRRPKGTPPDTLLMPVFFFDQ